MTDGEPGSHYSRGWALAAGTLLVLAACPPDGEPRLEVFPSLVQFLERQPATFELTAHLRGPNGLLINTDFVWNLIDPPTAGSIQLLDGPRGKLVKADANVPAGTYHVEVKAATYVETVTLEVTPSLVGPPGPDRAIANQTSTDPPSVVVVTAWHAGQCGIDQIFVFALQGALGDQSPGCSDAQDPRASLFGGARNVKAWPAYPWVGPTDLQAPDRLDASFIPPPPPPSSAQSQGSNTDDVPPPPPPPPPPAPSPYRVVGLKVWGLGGLSQTDVKNRVWYEAGIASGIFAEGLAGVVVQYDPTQIETIGDDVTSCDQLTALLRVHPEYGDPSLINVYYTPKLVWSRRGVWCGSNVTPPVTPNLILISNTNVSSTSLAHELGHAFGLIEPWRDFRGHVDQVDGMSSDNLMWVGIDDGTASTRYRLSVGQVYRINFDRRSWLTNPINGETEPITNCGCSPYHTTPCPKLSADTRPIGGAAASLPAGTCP